MQGKRLHQLDLNLLKVFEALFQHHNMTQAAQALNITPSAVSHAVKRLRRELGDPLFERDGHRMRPTAACQRMAPQLFDTLARLRQILQQWGEFDAAKSNQCFRLGIHPALETQILRAIMTLFKQSAPGLQLVSSYSDRALLGRELASGRFDAVVDVATAVKKPILHKQVMRDEFCVVAAADVYVERVIKLDQYNRAKHVVVSHRAEGAVLEDLSLQHHDIERDVVLRCQSYANAIDVIAGSEYLLTMPRSLAVQLPPSVVVMDTPVSLTPTDIQLYWHQHTDEDPANQWFREQLNKIMTEQRIAS